MRIKVLYFASLRDNSKKAEEVIETSAKTIDELYSELNSKYHFTLDQSQLRAALNEDYAPFTTELNYNDTVVFIPPVAGG